MSNYAVIIPAFNEEKTIASIVMLSKNYIQDVYVIDDGSTDRTVNLAEMSNAIVIKKNKNEGKAAAIFTALSQIPKQNYDAFVFLDADGQHDPKYIPMMLEKLNEGYDLVIGSRYLANNNKTPKMRRIGQKLLDTITNGLNVKNNITDSQSGFRVLNKTAIFNMDFKSENYSIESDMIIEFRKRGLKITEIPILADYSSPNCHKTHPIVHGFNVFSDIIGKMSAKNPIFFFGVPGFFFLSTGFLIGIYAFIKYNESLIFPISLSLFSIFLTIIGIILATTGIILNTVAQYIRKSFGCFI